MWNCLYVGYGDMYLWKLIEAAHEKELYWYNLYLSTLKYKINQTGKLKWRQIQTGIMKHCAWALSHFSHVLLFATLKTVACQAPLSMGFSRQEYWSGLSCPPPGDLPDPGIEPAFPVAPVLQVDSLPLNPGVKPQWSPKCSFFPKGNLLNGKAWVLRM